MNNRQERVHVSITTHFKTACKPRQTIHLEVVFRHSTCWNPSWANAFGMTAIGERMLGYRFISCGVLPRAVGIHYCSVRATEVTQIALNARQDKVGDAQQAVFLGNVPAITHSVTEEPLIHFQGTSGLLGTVWSPLLCDFPSEPTLEHLPAARRDLKKNREYLTTACFITWLDNK